MQTEQKRGVQPNLGRLVFILKLFNIYLDAYILRVCGIFHGGLFHGGLFHGISKIYKYETEYSIHSMVEYSTDT